MKERKSVRQWQRIDYFMQIIAKDFIPTHQNSSSGSIAIAFSFLHLGRLV